MPFAWKSDPDALPVGVRHILCERDHLDRPKSLEPHNHQRIQRHLSWLRRSLALAFPSTEDVAREVRQEKWVTLASAQMLAIPWDCWMLNLLK